MIEKEDLLNNKNFYKFFKNGEDKCGLCQSKIGIFFKPIYAYF